MGRDGKTVKLKKKHNILPRHCRKKEVLLVGLAVGLAKKWRNLGVSNCKLLIMGRMVVGLVEGGKRRIRDGRFPFVVAKAGEFAWLEGFWDLVRCFERDS